MRVIIVNVNSHIGSTGKIVYGLYKYLIGNGDEALICCRGVKEKKLPDNNIIQLTTHVEFYASVLFSRLFGYDGIFNPFATRKLKKIIERFKPDIVHLFNLPGYYLNYFDIMEYLKQQEIPTVYSMMDEFIYTAKCTYPYDCERFMAECDHCPQKKAYPKSWFFDHSNRIFKRKQKIYKGWNLLTLTGIEWSCNKAKKSAISKNNKIEIIPHPINSRSLYIPKDVNRLRQDLNIPIENRIILTVTDASAPRKGGKYFFAMAKRMEMDEGFTFIFVGYNRNDWEIPRNMITVGYVANQELLAEYYSLADLYVCVSLADTFPTTCLNALACGTKLLGFNAGGVPYCAPKDYGVFVPVGDVDALVAHVKTIHKKNMYEIEATRKFAGANYSEEVVYGKFYNVYKNYNK